MKNSLQPQEVHNNEIDKIQELISLGDGKITKEKQAVIVVGDTGEGKSTLINYIAQNKLYAEKKGYPPKYIINTDNQLGDIKIGNTSISETTVPNRWIDKDGVSYWDCPGFGDTKGVVQDVANGFYIKKLFDNIENVKVVVVVSEETIGGGRADKFLNLLKKLGNLFVDINTLKSSISLVITKASETNATVLKKFLSEELIPQQLEYLNDKQKSLLEFFASGKSQISFFESPKSAGEIDLLNAKQIKQTVSSIKYLNKPAINITVSSESLLTLEAMAKDINDQIKDVCRNINSDFTEKCEQILLNTNSAIEAKKSLLNLAKDIFNLTQEDYYLFQKNYDFLCNKWIIYNRSNDLQKFFNLLDFIAFVKHDITYNIASWNSVLDIRSVINNLCSNTEVQHKTDVFFLNKKVLYLKAKILDVDEILSKVHEFQKDFISVIVIASKILYLNKDLIIHGKHCAIICPNWKIVTKVVIDLSGNKGISYLSPATDVYGYGKSGIDGLPGLSGENGGDFYGIGKSFSNITKLIVNVSGGTGGKGQDGGNGSSGKNGNDASGVTRDDHKYSSYQTDFGFVFCFTRTIEVYKRYGESGGIGGDGGRGGAPGYGGHPGKVKIFDYQGHEVGCQVICNYGNNGYHGNGGKGGYGGKNGNNRIDRYDTHDKSWLRDGQKGWLREEIEVINTYAKNGIVPTNYNYQNRQKQYNVQSCFDESFFEDYMKKIIDEYDQIDFDVELSGCI